MMEERFSRLLACGVLTSVWVFLCGGCTTESTSARQRGLPAKVQPQGLPTYAGFKRGEWTQEDLEIPVGKLLSVAETSGTDTALVWGAAETALSAEDLRASQREGALALLEELTRRQPGSDLYLVRTLCHYVRWPDAYGRRARKLAQAHAGSENALVSYALAACALAWNGEGEARAQLLAASAKESFAAYELEALRASVHAMEEIGYSAFSARMLGFFQRRIPHTLWMSAMSRYYDGKAEKDLKEGAYTETEELLAGLLEMAKKARADADSLESEFAALNVAKRTLARMVDLWGRRRNPVAVRRIRMEMEEIDGRGELLEEYLERRNDAFEPRSPKSGSREAKSEREWIDFFDAVLAGGEVEAIRNDRMIEGPAPGRRVTVPAPTGKGAANLLGK